MNDSLDRRSFLSLTACGFFRAPAITVQDERHTADHWKSLGYHVTQILSRVNQIFVQRNPAGDGLLVEFVDYETMPHSDVSCFVPCASAELGVFVVGSVAYELSLWLQQKTSDVEALITLDSPATVTLLAHRERGRDVVVMMQK